MLLAQNLKKSYPNPEGGISHILDLNELKVESGEQVFLKGGSGSGKTTLLNILTGILKPDSGTVKIDDTTLWELNESKRDLFRAKNIGIIFQVFHLLPGLTALENVMIGMHFSGKVKKAHAIELLNEVGLSDRIHYKPAQLSVGQQQRVAVARALANQPKIVFADEPTGSLDPKMADLAMENIQKLCKKHNAALIWVSHAPDQIHKFDRSIDLKDLSNLSEIS